MMRVMRAGHPMAFEQAAFAPLQAEVELRLEAHCAGAVRVELRPEAGQHFAAPHARQHGVMATRCAAIDEPRQHARGRAIDMRHALEIEHRELQLVARADHIAQHGLDGREAQVALQFVDDGAAAVDVENAALGGLPAALRAHAGQCVAGPHRGTRGTRRLQEVQTEFTRQRLAHLYAARAVAARAERRREHADAELPRQHGDDAAAYAVLVRHADAVDPLAGEVVHAASGHHAQDRPDGFGGHGPQAARRIHATVRQGRGDQRQVAAIDAHRTLLEVELERGFRVFGEDLGVALHVADRAVAVAGRTLGLEHRGVDVERPPGTGRERIDVARQGASRVAPPTSEAVAMAPALILGFSGRLVPGFRLMELNASPLGSTPIDCSTRSGPRSSSATP